MAAFPAAWTSYEYLSSVLSPNGTFGSLAYSQADFPLVLQTASLGGLWAILVLLASVPWGLALAWHHGSRRRLSRQMAAAALLPLAVSLAFGVLRLAQVSPLRPIRVGLAAEDRHIPSFRTQDPGQAFAVLNDYTSHIAELTDNNVSAVVLPEKFMGVAPGFADPVYDTLSEAARIQRVALVAGLNRVGEEPLRNVALALPGGGGQPLEYEKARLVPGWEDGYSSGGRRGFIMLPGGIKAGIAICKDLDFPSWMRGYGRQGANIMLVPAWDFGVDAWLHSRMAVLRAVENGFSLARTAQEGLLTVADHKGRIIAERPSSPDQPVLFFADVRPGPAGTFYSRYGDWLPALTLLALFLLGLRWLTSLTAKPPDSPGG